MNKKHNWILGLLLVLCMLVLPTAVHAADQAHINLNGKSIDVPSNVQITSVKGSVMVPLRLVVEQLGYKVTWSSSTQTATIKQGNTVVALTANSTTANVNGNAVDLEAAPFVKGGTTLVPLRFLSENTGATVKWDNSSKTVYLSTPSTSTPTSGNPTNDSSTTPTSGTTTNGSSTTPASGTTASSNAMVDSISFSDNRMTITVEGNVTPKSSSLTGPDRIVLDLPKTALSAAFLNGQQMSVGDVGKVDVTGYPQVSGIRYSLFSDSPSAVRVVLDLTAAQKYKVITDTPGVIIVELDGNATTGGTTGTTTGPNGSTDNGSTPVPVTPGSGPGDDGKKVVVIDAGHGGSDPGAISITKKNEKDFTLAVVLKIQALLQQEPDIDFVLTRSDDSYPTLPDRVKIANNLHADVFVSIHGNSTSSAVSPSGTEIYYTRADSVSFAQMVHDHVVQALGLPDRGIHAKSLHVTRETTMPAVLVEAGYLSNAGDESLMYSDEFQQKLAQAVVDAIKQYLNVQ